MEELSIERVYLVPVSNISDFLLFNFRKLHVNQNFISRKCRSPRTEPWGTPVVTVDEI